MGSTTGQRMRECPRCGVRYPVTRGEDDWDDGCPCREIAEAEDEDEEEASDE